MAFKSYLIQLLLLFQRDVKKMNNPQADRISIASDGITFKADRRYNPFQVVKCVAWNVIFVIFFVFATLNFVEKNETCKADCQLHFCSPYFLFLLVAAVVYIGIFYCKIVKKYFAEFLTNSCIDPVKDFFRRIFRTLLSKFILFMTVVVLLILLTIFETRDDFHRLRSVIGIVSFILFGYVFSYKKFAVNWRPVLCGFSFQFLLGIFCIRWDVGRMIFKCFSDKVTTFLHFSNEGALFVFGDFLVNKETTVAFAVLPTIFFFSMCVSIFHYIGALQVFLMKLGWIFEATLGTSVCESVNAAGNIFLSQSECPMLIKPYIRQLTHSELHSILVSGFATVSGSVLAAYISYGAEAQHLITASVMAAPASLFFSKLFYPETEQSLTTPENIQIEKSPDSSVLDAASNGAKNGISLILNIIANLVGFIAFLAFADATVKWMTFLLGYNDVGIEFILGKIFIPVSWALGVEWEDCEAIGNVIGTKMFLNEFVAFRLLGQYKKAGEISLRSSAIATYAVCGFGNPSAMGIMIGALGALAPNRRADITKVAFRALVAGSIVSLITASIAGLLMTDEMIIKSNGVEILANQTVKFV